MTETVEKDPAGPFYHRVHCKEHNIWKIQGESCPGYGETLIKDYPAGCFWSPPKKMPNGDPIPDSSRPHIPEKD